MVALDSYTETSVSGNGVHVIVEASLNGHGRNRRGPFEVYESGRFFVVTGNHVIGTPTTVEERQAKLDEVLEHFLPPAHNSFEQVAARAAIPVDLDDQELLERAMRAKNGGDSATSTRAAGRAAITSRARPTRRSRTSSRFGRDATRNASTGCSDRAVSTG